jgi:hypothetical protein
MIGAQSFVSREALHRVFGPDAFSFGPFYAHAPALRFELSLGGHPLDQFAQAWDRARPIVDHAFNDARELVAVASIFAGPSSLCTLSRSLRALGVRRGRPRAWWTEPYVDERVAGFEPESRLFVAFAVDREAVHRLLWGALAQDLGIRPSLCGELYIANPERGVVVHPYDDRGMDVYGPNRALLAELYGRFAECLLEHDRARMDAFFGGRQERSG